MASGNITVSGYHWDGYISWSSSPISGQNASSVYAEFYVQGWGSAGTFWGSLSIGSTSESTSWNGLEDQVRTYIGSCSATVQHDSSGDASVYIGMSCVKPSGAGHLGDTLEGGETVWLDHIDQAGPSTISFSSDPAQMRKNLIIYISRDQSDCTHTLTYSFGGTSGTIATGAGASAQWAIPDLSAYCNNTTSGSCSITCKTYRQGKYLGARSRSLTLKVPDASIPDLTEATMGSEAKVTCPRGSANFRLSLSLQWQGKAVPISEGEQDSFLWTPSYDLAKDIPDLTEGTGTLELQTFNGTALVGKETRTIKLTVPENEETKPKITAVKLEPVVDPKLPAGLPYLRGKTGLKATITAESDYSSIVEYSTTVGGQTAEGNPGEIQILEQSGSLQAVVSVTDARGFKRISSQPVTIAPYDRPRVTPYGDNHEVICQRATKDGALSPQGTFLALRAGKKATVVMVEGVNLNPATLSYRWKATADPDFGAWIELLAADQTEISALISDIVTDLTSSYLIELRASDAIGEQDLRSYQIMTDAVSFSLYDGVDGAAFGKYAEEEHVVEIAPHMTLKVRGKIELPDDPKAGFVKKVNGKDPNAIGEVVVTPEDLKDPTSETLTRWLSPWMESYISKYALDIFYPIGKLWWSNDPTDPHDIVGGTWKRLKDVFILAAGDQYPVGAAGGEAAHTLTIKEMPIHEGHMSSNSGNGGGGFAGGYLPDGALGVYRPELGGRGWNANGNEIVPAGHSKGESQPHNNMPPYIAKYCWERIPDPAPAKEDK